MFHLAALVLATWPPLIVRMESPQQRVLVAEPLKVTLRFRALAPIKTFCGEIGEFTSYCGSALRFAVHDGRSVRTYEEFARSLDERIVVLGGLRNGQGFETTFTLYHGRYLDGHHEGDFLFPRAGRFRLQARYASHGVEAASNWLTIDAAAPDAEGQAILDVARRDLRLLGGDGGPEAHAALPALLAAHPHHPYLRLARIARQQADWSDRFSIGSPTWQAFQREHEALAPEAGRRAWFEFVAREWASYATSLVDEPDWGPFEDEKLVLIACAAPASTHAAERKRARRALLDRFPRSEAARRLKDCR